VIALVYSTMGAPEEGSARKGATTELVCRDAAAMIASRKNFGLDPATSGASCVDSVSSNAIQCEWNSSLCGRKLSGFWSKAASLPAPTPISSGR
jgi:hypothetical protein